MIADRSLKEYPQWGQQRRLQFFARRQPEHFTSFSENCFPHSGHLYDFSSAMSYGQVGWMPRKPRPLGAGSFTPDGEGQTLNPKFLISSFN